MENIAAIIVLYKPSEAQLSYWTNILPPPICENKLNLIFVDNTPETNFASRFENSIYIPLNENRGIATAQNIGIAKAREIGVQFVVFFDQDSQFDFSLIIRLQGEFSTIRNNGIKIGAIGPLLFDKQRGELYAGNVEEKGEPVNVDTLISSGMLTTLSVLDEVGDMADELFIDCVDLEWCWRAQKYGYKLFQSVNVVMPHQIGMKTIKFLGKSFLLSAPFRYYYQYRNAIWLSRLDYVPRRWKKKKIKWHFIQLLWFPWHTGQPIRTICSMLKGIFAGLKGTATGPWSK
jgi:rhamnosyltransferase